MNRILFFMLSILVPSVSYSQLSIKDHLGMENFNNPKINKHSGDIIFSKSTKETWNGKAFSSIVCISSDDEEQKELTKNEWDYDPKWSPSGEWISFISYRDNLQQIYIIPKSGGKATMVSDAQAYISNYQWINDSTIAYTDDEPRDSLLLAKEKENGGGYVVGTEYYTNALWMVNINTKVKKKITKKSQRIVEFEISSNGEYISMICAKNYDTYELLTKSWVEVIKINGKSIYTFNNANALNNVRFSPSGNHIAFVGSTEGYASNDGLFVANLVSKETKNLTHNYDPTIQKIQWIDEKNIVFSTPKNGYTGLYKVDFEEQIETFVKPYWVIYDFKYENENVIFSASRSSKTKQLYKLNTKNSPETAIALTRLNEAINSKIKTTSSVLSYRSKDGTDVQGIITYPPNYSKKQNYPLMTIPHGGPDAIVMDDFNWMGQFFADNGYVVFQPNFRGSIGYGRKFYAGNRGKFGKTDFEDILAGVDRLVESGIADDDKLIIGGWSYGGYMANWAITQTNRFKAAISTAGISNLVSLYGQHEFSNRDIALWEYNSLPIDSIEIYRKASPVFYVKNAQTPLLIIHGANDTRSPTLQAWEMYRAMKDAKKEVQMIIYPGAGHSIGNPIQFRSVLKNWLDWSDKNIKN